MFDKMKQLMEFKRQADQIKKELDAIMVESNEVAGIKVVITGSQEFRSIEVAENMLAPERKKEFERDLFRSMNAAMKKSQQAAAQKMSAVMPGVG